MFNWLHHLIEPHCPQCELEKHYITETLKLLLEQERAEKFRLLNLLAPSQQIASQVNDPVDLSGLRRNPRAIMRDLERKSAEQAEELKKRAERDRIASIEQELGVQ